MPSHDLIAQLAGELQPRAPMRPRTGLALVAASLAFTVILVAGVAGLWWSALAGEASSIYYIVSAMLLLLGASAASATVAMASPRVGQRQDGPRWGLAMIAVLPLTALIFGFAHDHSAREMVGAHGLDCLIWGTVSGLFVLAALTLWLRRGAPVSLNAAGLYAGVAAGALGSFAYGLSCPLDGMVHFGLWHVLPVAIGGLVGRLALPRLIRW